MKPVDLLAAVTEKEWQASVEEWAAQFRWTSWHVSDARMVRGGRLVGDRRVAGLPDLILVHAVHGFAFVELKTQKGRLRPEQTKALHTLAEAAARPALSGGPKVRVHLWRPGDADDVVVPLLRDGRGPVTYGFQ